MNTALLAACAVGSAFFFLSTAGANTLDDSHLSKLINTGQLESARNLLQTQNPTEAQRLFFEGRVFKAQGKLAEAVNSFEGVLKVDPDYINAKRELAHTLLLQQDYYAAESHFSALLGIETNQQMMDQYRRFLSIINQNKPIGVSGFASIAPSTNVNRGSRKAVFDTNLGRFVIDDDSRKKSGVGIQAGISGYYRHLIDPTKRFVLNWGVSGTRYKVSDYNSTIGNIGVSFEHAFSPTRRWSITPYYRKTWTEGSGDNYAVGVRLRGSRELGKKNRLSSTISHEYRKYPDNENNNGTLSAVSANLSRQLMPDVMINAGLKLEAHRPKSEHSQYKAYKPFAGITKSWQNGLQTGFNIEFGHKKFAQDFPLMNFPRDDKYYRLGISLHHAKFELFGLKPQLSCYFTRNRSNISLYEHDATDCQTLAAKSF